MPDPAWTISRRFIEIATAAVLVVFGSVILLGATQHGIGWTDEGPASGYFPFYAGILLVVASVTLLLQLVFRGGEAAEFVSSGGARRAGGFFLGIVAAVIGAYVVGFYVTILLFIPTIILASGHAKAPKAISIGVAITVFFFVFFELWLRSPLMKGPLERLLGFY